MTIRVALVTNIDNVDTVIEYRGTVGELIDQIKEIDGVLVEEIVRGDKN